MGDKSVIGLSVIMGYTIAFHERSASVVAGTCGKVVGIAVYLNCELLLLEVKMKDPRFYVM
jgi:hypothetical protein